jgi:hypothetical protein
VRSVKWVVQVVTCAPVAFLATDCGGESRVVPPIGTAGAGGTTAGNGSGGRAVTGGSSSGGRSGASATGGTGGGGVGGRNPSGGFSGSGSSGSGGTLGGAGAGGEPGDPFSHCPTPPLRDGTTCSLESTCDALECGKPWSLHDEKGCLRKTCSTSGDCAADERCLAAPVVGGEGACWSSACESCEELANGCGCSCFDNCELRMVCVPLSVAPPEDDCPTEGLSCQALRSRYGDLLVYLDDVLEDDIRDSVEACNGELIRAEPEICDACETWEPDDYFAGVTPRSVLDGWEPLCGPGTTIEVVEACDYRALVLTNGQNNVVWLLDAAGALVGFKETVAGGDCGLETTRAGLQLQCSFDGPNFCNELRPRQLSNKDRIVQCDVDGTACNVCSNASCDIGPIGAGGAADAPE